MKGLDSGKRTGCAQEEAVLEKETLLPALMCCCKRTPGQGLICCVAYTVCTRHYPCHCPVSLLVERQLIPNRRHCCIQSFQEGLVCLCWNWRVRWRAECSSSTSGQIQDLTVSSQLICALPTVQRLPCWLQRTGCHLFLWTVSWASQRSSTASAWPGDS